MSNTASAHQAVEQIVRKEWGRVLAALIHQVRDFEIAEDALQDALIAALSSWPENGLPDIPAAWLLATAKRKAIDRFRRNKTISEKMPELQAMAEYQQSDSNDDAANSFDEPIKDERLRLIFTCCHPALAESSQVALTLKSVTGMATSEIARSYLVSDETMAQRIVRAKRKIRATNIPYKVPEPEAWPERMRSVLSVIYLIFNEGYSASHGDVLVRSDLCAEAIRLCELLSKLLPKEHEVAGLLSLMLLHASRQPARSGIDGELITLEHQDRTKWINAHIKRGTTILINTLTKGAGTKGAGIKGAGKNTLGPYQIQAAISAAHSSAPTYQDTNWHEIALLYEKLYEFHPTPVVLLNGAVAVSFAHGPEAGLAGIDQIAQEGSLENYQPYFAARADMLRRAGQRGPAIENYRKAIELSGNTRKKFFLNTQLLALEK